MKPYPRIVILAVIACFLAGCDEVSVPSIDSIPTVDSIPSTDSIPTVDSLPVVGPKPVAAHHVVFGDTSIESNMRIEPSHVQHEQTGILDIQLNFRSVTEADQYLEAYVTFTRNGQFVEKLGPTRVVLRGKLSSTLYFVSTQPADDYMVNFDLAR